MKEASNRAALACASLALLLALGACGDRIDNTEMPQPDQPSVEINRQGEPGAAKQEDASARSGPEVVGATSAPAITEDQRIASQVQQVLASDADLGGMKIDVHAQDGVVTLRGRAPDPTAREKASGLVRDVSGVRNVDNLLTLG